MKRKIAELRRALLDVETASEAVRYHRIGHPEGYYHAVLLTEGGYLRAQIDGDEAMLLGLTNKGHDLLDQLRDEEMLAVAQDMAEAQGHDRDHLAFVLRQLELNQG